MACRTGFQTAKGSLLRQILHPKPHQLGFASDAVKFILLMFVLGVLFYIWSIVSLIRLVTVESMGFHTHGADALGLPWLSLLIALPKS